MASSDDTNELLREIRDLLAEREQQYADHLQKLRDEYDRQLAQARQERERSINRLSIVAAIVAGAAYAVYQWGS